MIGCRTSSVEQSGIMLVVQVASWLHDVYAAAGPAHFTAGPAHWTAALWDDDGLQNAILCIQH